MLTPDRSKNQNKSDDSTNETQFNQPRDLLVLPLPRFHLQTLLIHLMYIPCRLHVTQDVILQIADWLEWVGHVLVLLDVTNDFGGFGALGEIDELCAFYDGGYAVFDEGQVCEINACEEKIERLASIVDWMGEGRGGVPKKGIQGGLARWSVSRYSPKFLVLPMSRRRASRRLMVRALTCAQVR